MTTVRATKSHGGKPFNVLSNEDLDALRKGADNLAAHVQIVRQYGLPCVAPAVVRNVSAGGFGISLGRKPPVGSLRTVRTPQTSMPCVVRQVHPDHGAFLIGVALLPIRDGTTPTPTS